MATKVLITGATGFLGSALIEGMTYKGSWFREYDTYEYREDICNPETLENFFSFVKPDYVYHLAAASSDKLSHYSRVNNYSVNVVGTANVINSCIRNNVKKLIFSSSNAVYGNNYPTAVPESYPCSPNSPYGLAKLASELDIQLAHKHFGLNYTILRLHNIYGENQKYLKHKNIVTNFIYHIMNNKEISLYGTGNQLLNFTYVKDLIDPMINVMKLSITDNQIYNLGATSERSLGDLIEIIERHTNKIAKIKFIDTKFNFDTPGILHRKSLEHNLWLDETLLYEGIRICCNKFNNDIPEEEPLKLEVTQNIPENWKK